MRSLLYRTSSYSTPAQSRPSFTWSNASGRRGFSSEPIVSSKTRRSRPWYRFVYASFRTNARAFPMWSGPLGYGARRRTTFASALPSCRTALANANFLAESRLTVVRTERAYKDFFGTKAGRHRAMDVVVPDPENGLRRGVSQKVSQERLCSAGRPTIRGPGVVEAALPAGARRDRVRDLGDRALHPRRRRRDPGRTDGRADRGRPASDRPPDRALRRLGERGPRPGPGTDRLLPLRLRRWRGDGGANPRDRDPRVRRRRRTSGDRDG